MLGKIIIAWSFFLAFFLIAFLISNERDAMQVIFIISLVFISISIIALPALFLGLSITKLIYRKEILHNKKIIAIVLIAIAGVLIITSYLLALIGVSVGLEQNYIGVLSILVGAGCWLLGCVLFAITQIFI